MKLKARLEAKVERGNSDGSEIRGDETKKAANAVTGVPKADERCDRLAE